MPEKTLLCSLDTAVVMIDEMLNGFTQTDGVNKAIILTSMTVAAYDTAVAV